MPKSRLELISSFLPFQRTFHSLTSLLSDEGNGRSAFQCCKCFKINWKSTFPLEVKIESTKESNYSHDSDLLFVSKRIKESISGMAMALL